MCKSRCSVFLLAALALAATGCSKGETAPGGGKGDAKGEGSYKYKVGLLTYSLAEEFGVDTLRGAERTAEKVGMKIIAPDPSGDLQKQISQLEDFIQQKVDAVIISPIDGGGIVPYVKEARKAGIKIINYDIEAATEVEAKVLSDNKEGGRMSARHLVGTVGEKAKVLILSDNPGVITAMERIDGFKEIMAQHPGIKLVEQISNGTRDTHQKTTENMLTAHPDIDAIFCFDGDHTLGAYAALQGLGNKKTLIAGYDASPEQIAIMKKEGAKCQIISSVALFPKAIGRIAVDTCNRVLSGEKITGVVYTDIGLATREKIGEFVDKD